MLLIFLFSFIVSHEILARCDHDEVQKKIPRPFHDDVQFFPSVLDQNERKPIRIYFDLTSLKSNSRLMCHKPGQVLLLEDNKTSHICRESEIFGANDVKNLETTLNNLANFSSRLMKVTRTGEKISPGSSVYDIRCSSTPVDADLFIAVAKRYYSHESKILGQAFYSRSNNLDNRPIIGGMYLNPEYFPSVPQDENSIERLFFATIFHEMCHVFGISDSAMSSWIDRRTGKRYNPFPRSRYFNKTYEKTFSILQTPKAREYIKQRFGITEFAPGVEAGIEIEDGGGGGTAGSHPESRVYLSETMCGIFVGYTFISNLTLSILEDTGWYDVDYSMGELYAWGDGKSMGKSPLKTFINTAPQLAYPHHYLCWPENVGKQCHYDFRAKAFCSPLTKYDCKSSAYHDQACCKMWNFTNPLNVSIRGDRDEFDYLVFKVPNTTLRCQDTRQNNDDARKHGEFFSEDSMCAMSTLGGEESEAPGCYQMMCDKGNRLFVTVNNQMVECQKENEKIMFAGIKGTLVCPPPDLLCGMKNFLKRPKLSVNETSTQPTQISAMISPSDSHLISPSDSHLISPSDSHLISPSDSPISSPSDSPISSPSNSPFLSESNQITHVHSASASISLSINENVGNDSSNSIIKIGLVILLVGALLVILILIIIKEYKRSYGQFVENGNMQIPQMQQDNLSVNVAESSDSSSEAGQLEL